MTQNRTIKFITGNKIKVKEMVAVLGSIKIAQVDIDLPEIQEISSKKIIEFKLKEAFKKDSGPFIIEDSGLYFGALKGQLPGPLVKWFNDTIGAKGLYDLAKGMGNVNAIAKTTIAYAKNEKNILYFEGIIKGKIVKPRGKYIWGYDEIFMPLGQNKTLSELKFSGDFKSSPRGKATEKLRKYLLKNKL